MSETREVLKGEPFRDGLEAHWDYALGTQPLVGAPGTIIRSIEVTGRVMRERIIRLQDGKEIVIFDEMRAV